MPKKKKAAQTENSKKQNVEKPAANQGPKERPIVRAIRVTPQLLAAAKVYKKEKGVSFYQLGLEAISERLIKEGFLKESAELPK